MSDLFKEFDPVGEKQWKTQVQAELKGADFAETLVSEAAEGFQVKPLYTSADHSQSNFVVGENKWKIVTGFMPSMDIAYGSVDGIILQSDQLSEFQPTAQELIIASFKNEIPAEKALNENTWLEWDFLGDLAEFGNYVTGTENDLKGISASLKDSGYKNNLSVNIARYQNAGANHAEQLALMLLTANEYAEMSDYEHVFKKTLVKTAVGINFFFEVAKLRAMRILWQNLCEARGLEGELTILAESSMRNKSLMDKHNNLIRTTFEAAAAILGNADFVSIYPYDELFEENREMSLELGFKQQFVLREESFLNHYADALKGSYFMEFLTEQLAVKAWEIFKRLESEGGFRAGLKSEKIQQMIAASAQKEQEKFDAGKLNMIGVNKYPKAEDDFVKFAAKPSKQQQGRTLYRTITPVRLAAKAEKQYAEN